jgi:hypothetical protein
MFALAFHLKLSKTFILERASEKGEKLLDENQLQGCL